MAGMKRRSSRRQPAKCLRIFSEARAEDVRVVQGGGREVGGQERAGDAEVEGDGGRVAGVGGEVEVDLLGGDGGGGEVFDEVDGEGGCIGDLLGEGPGEAVVTGVAEAIATTRDLVVAVGEGVGEGRVGGDGSVNADDPADRAAEVEGRGVSPMEERCDGEADAVANEDGEREVGERDGLGEAEEGEEGSGALGLGGGDSCACEGVARGQVGGEDGGGHDAAG